MTNVVVSANGQIKLPASLRRRLGLETGTELEVSEEPDGVRLRIVRAVHQTNLAHLAGLVTAPSRGKPRRLEDFDPASLLARERSDNEPALVTITVLLELEWVMRGFYGLARAEITRVLRAVLNIEHLTIEDHGAAAAALHAFEAGLDFADALHLARSGPVTAVLTFDRRLVKRACAQSTLPPVQLLIPLED